MAFAQFLSYLRGIAPGQLSAMQRARLQMQWQHGGMGGKTGAGKLFFQKRKNHSKTKMGVVYVLKGKEKTETKKKTAKDDSKTFQISPKHRSHHKTNP